MVFTGELDNLDGLTIRNECDRPWHRFGLYDCDENTGDVREVEVAFSRNMLQEMRAVGLVGEKACRVRVTVEVLP